MKGVMHDLAIFTYPLETPIIIRGGLFNDVQ